ncbi:FimV/HubP family polar landmark protein, partial [Thiothrix eikelboomii]|uniref:FimV/HubP family polar landmark protein n=1 Tax=Thiothrix eikelboomii TaxID=92487 RepID=UPI003BAF4646
MLKPILPIMLLGLALSMPVEATRSYGPVKDQDTLWSIATQLRPDQGATVQQTMLALYYKNPQAFASNNINSLMKGAVLKAPSSAEARRYQRLGALREARKHNVYWTRGAQLPYTVPPPVPKIKERANPKRSKVVTVKASVSEASPARSTERRITRLQAQLQSVESKNQRLTAELQALQAKQTQSKPSPQLDAQVKKLKLELQELTSVLGQKDNHIKTLQASLKNASETIKSQHVDNMRLYDKLKEVSPSSLPASPSSEGKSELKLTTVEAATAAVASNNQGSKDTPSKSVWADQQTTPNKQASTTPTESTPTESTPTESTPTESTPTESASTESTPTESTPTESTPTESTPTESTPTESTPTESTPTEST